MYKTYNMHSAYMHSALLNSPQGFRTELNELVEHNYDDTDELETVFLGRYTESKSDTSKQR